MARREAPLCKGRDALPGGGGFGLQRRGRPPCPCTWACPGLYSPPAIPRLDTRPAWKLSHPSSKATGCPGRPSGGRVGRGGFLLFPWDRDLATPHPSPAEHTHPLPHAQARTQVHTCQHTTRVPACSDAVRTRSLAPRAAPASCRRPRPAASRTETSQTQVSGEIRHSPSHHACVRPLRSPAPRRSTPSVPAHRRPPQPRIASFSSLTSSLTSWLSHCGILRLRSHEGECERREPVRTAQTRPLSSPRASLTPPLPETLPN